MKSFADEERKIKIDEIEPADSSTCVMHASWTSLYLQAVEEVEIFLNCSRQ